MSEPKPRARWLWLGDVLYLLRRDRSVAAYVWPGLLMYWLGGDHPRTPAPEGITTVEDLQAYVELLVAIEA